MYYYDGICPEDVLRMEQEAELPADLDGHDDEVPKDPYFALHRRLTDGSHVPLVDDSLIIAFKRAKEFNKAINRMDISDQASAYDMPRVMVIETGEGEPLIEVPRHPEIQDFREPIRTWGER